jgi:arsenate reductase (glutaredoxin)
MLILVLLCQNRRMIIVYGIPNCDTVRKARAWLTSTGLTHEFYDFKKRGVPAGRLVAWIKALGCEKLLNRQGSTWRKLDASSQAGAANEVGAQALMLASPSLIRRPVVEWGEGSQTTVGFDAKRWSELAASTPSSAA